MIFYWFLYVYVTFPNKMLPLQIVKYFLLVFSVSDSPVLSSEGMLKYLSMFRRYYGEIDNNVLSALLLNRVTKMLVEIEVNK